jgi:two-component system, OmpR family, sensor kinase
MKLINITTRYYIVLFVMVLALWSVAFYFIMRHQIHNNSDEVLFNRAHNIVSRMRANPSDLDTYPLADFSFSEISGTAFEMLPDDTYSDTLIYEGTDDEFDEYRKLVTKAAIGNQHYKLTVVKPMLESTEIFNTILETLLPLSVLMIVILILSARFLNQRLWQPFYRIIDFLSHYRIDQEARFNDEKLVVDEFDRLRLSMHALVVRNKEVFQQQKQFIENASHETQTPLAVIQSQLEVLLQSPDLSQNQAELIQSALNETDRLTKLNKALLLMSKIENQQFLETGSVDLHMLIERLVSYFDDKREKLKLTVKIISSQPAVIQANAILAEVLIGNLIKNAFRHNVAGGSINIRASSSLLVVENTGASIPAAGRVFERFYNGGEREGWGLGLAIVKKIVDMNHWTIEYSWEDQKHRFCVKFR